jgi:hypothetical protein
MSLHASKRQRACSCDYCTTLREARRRMIARRNHPHYAARGNEQPLLQDLIDTDPPEGGLPAYVADLSKE